MARVTAAVLAKEFGVYRNIAQREPVIVTNHGREDVVILSNAEYERLKSLDRRVQHAWEMDQATANAIANARSSAEAEALDHLLD